MQTSYCSRFKKNIFIFTAISLFVIHSLYALVLSPLSVLTRSNVDFMIPVLVDAVYFLSNLAVVAGWLTAFASVVYSAYRFGRRHSLVCSGMIVLMIIYKYLALTISVVFINGSLPESAALLSSLALPLLLDFALLAIVLAITFALEARVSRFVREKKALEGHLSGYAFDERGLFFPFKKLFDHDNPIQRNIFYVSITVTASRVAQLLISDIIAGPPVDFIDFLWMALYYISGLLLGFASYLFMLYLATSFDCRDMKMKYSSGGGS